MIQGVRVQKYSVLERFDFALSRSGIMFSKHRNSIMLTFEYFEHFIYSVVLESRHNTKTVDPGSCSEIESKSVNPKGKNSKLKYVQYLFMSQVVPLM